MDERHAREVVLARALETADGGRELVSDADRAQATRAAAQDVGETATDDAFIARRAALIVERLARKHSRLERLTRPLPARGWIVPVACAVTFVVGAAGVDIGAAHRINLLAPPVLALLAWNVAVYVALVVAALVPGARHAGPLRQWLIAWRARLAAPSAPKGRVAPALAAGLASFGTEWPTLAAPLWKERAATLLHLCAATLAAGAIAGLYVRGIALEYRVSWQSTFLDANDVARLLHVVLAPGSWLTGLAIPDARHLATIAGDSAGENAARWIHLHGATLLLVVILPRLALAGIAAFRARRLARHFPLPLREPHFERLLRVFREGTAQVVALPYSYDVPPAQREGLARLLARAFESPVDIAWSHAVAYGDDALPDVPAGAPSGTVVVFNLTATPEAETHVAFVAALAQRLGAAPVVVVDTTDFTGRFGDHPGRVAEREAAWREALEPLAIAPLFVRLADPDLRASGPALAQRLAHAT
ncbi:MAG: DUF2868 domain-containing protein [Rudaea sp.]